MEGDPTSASRSGPRRPLPLRSQGLQRPLPLRPGTRAPPPPPAWGPGALSLRPLQGLESGASPNSLSPAPVRGLEPSIHTPRAPDLPVPERPLSRAPHRRPRSPAPRRQRQTQGLGCVLRRGAAKASRPEAGRGILVSGPRMPPAKRRIFQGPLRRKLSCPPTPLASPAFHLRKPQVSDSSASGVNGMAYGILRFGREMLARGTFCHAERRLALGKDSRNSLGTLDFPSPFTSFL